MDADSYLKVEKAVIHSWAARGFCERVLNSCICQDCDVKTSKVTLTFHYLFFILICYISVLSFIYNLCWSGNHLQRLLSFGCVCGTLHFHYLCACCHVQESLSEKESDSLQKRKPENMQKEEKRTQMPGYFRYHGNCVPSVLASLVCVATYLFLG